MPDDGAPDSPTGKRLKVRHNTVEQLTRITAGEDGDRSVEDAGHSRAGRERHEDGCLLAATSRGRHTAPVHEPKQNCWRAQTVDSASAQEASRS